MEQGVNRQGLGEVCPCTIEHKVGCKRAYITTISGKLQSPWKDAETGMTHF